MRVPDVADLPPALADGRERPDPARGVFDTMLVREGEAVRATEHLARLAASVAELYDALLPDDAAERVRAAAATVSPGDTAALRVDACPQPGGRVVVELALHPRRERALPIVLDPFVLPGGLGRHKWADRRLVDALVRDGMTPLLVDADGTVLEAAWGNVFVLEGDVLVTPLADGRILPGVTRAAALALSGARWRSTAEEPLSLARLAAADAILISSALAWMLPARLRGASEPAD